MKDKLWFFGAFRNAHYDKPIANTFDVPAGAQRPGGVQAVPGDARLVRAGRLGREDGQPDRPPDLADVAAQQVRGLHGPRDAPARPRDGRLTDPATGVGRVAHADLRDRLGQVDVDGVVEAAASRPASRSTASATTTSTRTASTSRTPHAGLVRRRAQERQQHRPAVERVERAARQLPRQVQRDRRRCRTSPARTTSRSASSGCSGARTGAGTPRTPISTRSTTTARRCR